MVGDRVKFVSLGMWAHGVIIDISSGGSVITVRADRSRATMVINVGLFPSRIDLICTGSK